MKITCSKRYSDIPFAHRQPNHLGHCRFIHGHNWGFEFTFSASELDECGFVIDFGRLQPLKEMLDKFDHALVLNSDDPLANNEHLRWVIMETCEEYPGNLLTVPDCSAEGLARFVLEQAGMLIRVITKGRVEVTRVTCFEDSKNSATCER